MRLTKYALVLMTVVSPAFGSFLAHAGSISLKGSDTMVVLGQRWAEEYMKGHKATSVQVMGGGSGTGISALINGTIG